jgi:hypothetical protein
VSRAERSLFMRVSPKRHFGGKILCLALTSGGRVVVWGLEGFDWGVPSGLSNLVTMAVAGRHYDLPQQAPGAGSQPHRLGLERHASGAIPRGYASRAIDPQTGGSPTDEGITQFTTRTLCNLRSCFAEKYDENPRRSLWPSTQSTLRFTSSAERNT